jgi:hypothetical protein
MVPIVYLPGNKIARIGENQRMNMHTQINSFAQWLSTASITLSLAILGCGGQPQQTGSNLAGVRISGQINELAGTCPNTSFKLGSKRVGTDASSAFVDRSCSDLRNGAAIEVEGGWNSDGSVMAQRVRGQPEPPESEIRGAISGLTGTCPNLSFSVGTQGVITDASTRFKDRECSGIRNGQSIEVHGIHQADGRVLAEEVQTEDELEGVEVEVRGAIQSVNGSCPGLTFFVGDRRIATNIDTRFERVTCTDLRSGIRVEAKGIAQADRSVLATRVKLED